MPWQAVLDLIEGHWLLRSAGAPRHWQTRPGWALGLQARNCHAISKPSGTLPSTVRISAVSTSPVALLRLEKATDPTVSFSRIINCARLTARRASRHSIASPGENLFSTPRNETATYRVVQGLPFGCAVDVDCPVVERWVGLTLFQIKVSPQRSQRNACMDGKVRVRGSAQASRIFLPHTLAAQISLWGQKCLMPAGQDQRREQRQTA